MCLANFTCRCGQCQNSGSFEIDYDTPTYLRREKQVDDAPPAWWVDEPLVPALPSTSRDDNDPVPFAGVIRRRRAARI